MKYKGFGATLLMLCVLLLTLCLFGIINKLVTFDEKRIDWTATAAMIGAVTGIIALVVNLAVAIRFNAKQQAQTDSIEKLRIQSGVEQEARKVFNEAIKIICRPEYPKVINTSENHDRHTTFLLASLNDVLGCVENHNLAFRICEAYCILNEEKSEINKMLNIYQWEFLPNLKEKLNNLNNTTNKPDLVQNLLNEARVQSQPLSNIINEHIRKEYHLKTKDSDSALNNSKASVLDN